MAEVSVELEYGNVRISADTDEELRAALVAMVVAYYDAADSADSRGHEATAKSYRMWAKNLSDAADTLEEDWDESDAQLNMPCDNTGYCSGTSCSRFLECNGMV